MRGCCKADLGFNRKTGLTQHLAFNLHNGVLDDTAFYQSIGANDWSNHRHTQIAHCPSHEMHVTGLARWIADELAKGKGAGPPEVRAAAEAKDPAGGSSKPPDTRSGGGRMLDLPILFGQAR